MAEIIDLAARRDGRVTPQRNAARLPEELPEPLLLLMVEQIDRQDTPEGVWAVLEKWSRAFDP